MKVDFMILGAARSATTSLSTILASHPSISFSKPKEPQFFSKEDWKTHLDSYHKCFKKKQGVLYGEGSTNYTKYPSFNKNIHQDIYEYNPEAKFIYIVRKPIDRIISHYKFAIERGYANKNETIDDAIINIAIYVNTSKYFSQIDPYIQLFGRDKIKIVLFDDFKNKPEKVVSSICQFLDITNIDIPSKYLHVNQSSQGAIGSIVYDNPKSLFDLFKKSINYIQRRFLKTKKPSLKIELKDSTKAFINKSLKEDIKNLELLLQKDLAHWKV